MNKSNRTPLIDALLPQARPMALEQRFMFDAAAVTAVTDPQYAPEAVQSDSTANDSDLARFAEPATVTSPVTVRALDVALNNGRKEVAFIDTGVTDYQTLVDGISAGVEVVLLDAGQDGLAQMALWAQSHSGYDAIHVLSHGTSGELQLGNTILNINNISTYAINAKLSLIGKSLTPDGDFLLYGCDIAADDEGQRFIKNISKVTGADISASIDSTGIERMGGNWELEYSIGNIYNSLSPILNFNNILTLNTSQASIPLSEATTYPGYIQVGDFNGDGAVDMLIQDGTSASVTLWANNGSGVFTNAGQAVAPVTNLQLNFASFRVADFDNDGDLDLYQRISGLSNDLYLANNGSGQFTVGNLPLIDSGTTSHNSIQIGDFNNDGAIDILTQEGNTGTSVTLWLNNGSGVFSNAGEAVAATTNFTISSSALRVADIDNDGDLDLYLRVNDTSNDIFFANNGVGQFVSSALPLVDTGVSTVGYLQVGDFNNDGAIDILTQEGGIGTPVTLWLNDGNGSFTSNLNFVAAIAGFQLNIQGLRVADFDNDGDLDIYQRGGGASDDLLIKTNDAPPTLNQVQPSSNSQGIIESSNIVLSFINSNALSKGAGDVYIYIDDGDGNFSNDVIFEGFSVTDSRVSLSGDATSSTVTIDPSGTFSANTTYYLVINPLSFTDADGKGFITKLGTRYHIGVPDPAIQFAGNSIDNLPDRTILSFTTGSTTVVSNAAPILTTPTAITLVDTSSTDTFSNQTGTLSATDADADTIASYGIQGGTTGGSDVIGAATYDVSKLGTYGTLYVKSSDGSYVYVPNASAINGRLTNTSETFTVTATDNNASPATGTATLTVNITGVNDSPTDIGLTATSVSQSGGANATVGTLSTTDADTGDTHTYTLVSGVGDTNNGLFNISGTSLRAINAGSMTPGTYTVRVQTTDAASATYAEAMTITVVDNVTPTVASVSVPANAWYVAGQNLDFTVNFSESVTVVITGGTPRIALTVGTTTVYADYVSGSGTSALVFRYTVQANDLDTNGIALGALALNGGSLADAAGNNAVLTLNSVGSTSAVLVDAVTPSAPSTPDLALASDSGTSGTDNITSDTTPTFTGTAEANSTVTLYDSDGTTVLGTATADGTGAWTITSSTLSGGAHNITVKTTDAAGNTSAASSPLAITVDATAPSAVTLSTTSVADTAAINGSTVATLSATDNPGVTYALVAGANDTNNGSFTISGGNLQAAANLAAGTYNIRVQATDAAGNTTEQTFTITVTAGPSVSSINRAAGSALTNATSVDFTVTFNESVTGVDTSDFALTTTGTAAGSIASITGSGTTYTVTVNGLSGDGTLRLDLDNSGTGIVNAGTQAITGGYTSGQTYTLDTSSPTAPTGLDLDASSDSGTSTTDNVTSDNTPTVSGAGAEPGSTVTLYDTDGTTVLGTTTADGAGAWTITASALSDGVHTLTAKVTDDAGNTGAASTPLSVTIDTTAPSAPGAIDLDSASDTGISNSDNVTSDTTPTFNGTAEANSTVTLYDTDGTTVLGTTTADSSGNWTITASTLAGGSHTLTVKAKDAAGNESGASSSLSVTIDTTAPNAPTGLDVLASSDSGTSNTDNITSNNTPTVSGAGAEPGSTVKLYDTDGTTVLGTATADSSGNWSVTTSALADGTHTLTAKVTDTAGNVGAASSSLTVTIDSTAPGASGTPVLASGSDSGASNADNITSDTTPTITGSGAEAGATVTLYDTDGTTVLGTATADGSGNWSITSSTLSEGAHTLTTKVTDTAGNTSVASASLAITFDTTAPTAITLSANSVMDVATGTNTAVATLSSTDTQSVSYTLEAGNGTNDAGNASFVIAGGVLQSRSQLTAGTYNIRVGATDAAGNISYQTFVITVNTNTAPTITSGASGTVAENAATSTVVYTATATDVDAGQTLSYSLTGTDAGSFDINASTGEVTLKASANYEAKASYSFNVVATDNGTGTLTDTKAVTVTVTDVNEAPTGSLTINGTVKQGEILSVQDTLEDDDGMTDKAYQWYADGQLIVGANQNTLTLGQDQVGKVITVKASYTDRNGRVEVSSSGTVQVVNTNDPTTGEVSVSGDAGIGQTLTASNTLSDADGMGDVQYQWQYKDANGDWRDITLTDGTLATGNQYTVDPAYALAELRVQASFTDGQGTPEVRYSTANIKAGGLPPTPVITAPVINPVIVVQPSPVADVIPAPVVSFMSVSTVNSIPVLASGPTVVSTPAILVVDSPAQTPASAVVSLGVTNSAGSSTSGLRAIEASRDVVIERGEQATFTLPAGTFVHTDGAAQVTLSARLADGRPLPANVKFNPTTGTFTVEAAPGEQAEQLQVVVNAVDDKGQTATTTLVIKLKEKASNSSALELPIKLGKLSLGEQIRMADKSAGQMAELAALSKAFAASQHARSYA